MVQRITSPMSSSSFWGPITSSEDWCEPNHLHTPYIAEFWNTLSSVPIVVFSLAALVVGIRGHFLSRFTVPCALTALVGLGSIAFHATLQYWGQAMDELFMVYAATAYMAMIALCDRVIPSRLVVPLAVAWSVSFTVAYIFLSKGPFFSASHARLRTCARARAGASSRARPPTQSFSSSFSGY